MTLLLKQIFGFVKLLNSETGTNQIAAGIAAGFVLGMTPFFSLQSILIFLCLFLFRVQIGAAFIAAFFFKFVAYLFDPAFDSIGGMILQMHSLSGVFTDMYNMPIVPLTRFNNTIVMGSGVVSLILAPFVYVGSRIGVIKYRATVVARIKGSKLWHALKATSLFKWYYKYDQLTHR